VSYVKDRCQSSPSTQSLKCLSTGTTPRTNQARAPPAPPPCVRHSPPKPNDTIAAPLIQKEADFSANTLGWSLPPLFINLLHHHHTLHPRPSPIVLEHPADHLMGLFEIRAPTLWRIASGTTASWNQVPMTAPSNFTTFQDVQPHDAHPSFGHLILLVFGAVLEVVCVSLPGYIIARLGYFDAEKQRFLADLNMMLFTPCLSTFPFDSEKTRRVGANVIQSSRNLHLN